MTRVDGLPKLLQRPQEEKAERSPDRSEGDSAKTRLQREAFDRGDVFDDYADREQDVGGDQCPKNGGKEHDTP